MVDLWHKAQSGHQRLADQSSSSRQHEKRVLADFGFPSFLRSSKSAFCIHFPDFRGLAFLTISLHSLFMIFGHEI